MPRFKYTAKTEPTKTIQGEIEAETQQDAVNKLHKMNYYPLSVHAEGAAEEVSFLGRQRVSDREIALFTRQLSTLVESGVNILNGLNICLKQTPNKRLRLTLEDVAGQIRDGKSLSDSLALHPDLFGGLYTSLVHSGEIGGNIQLSLKRLTDFLEKEEELKSSVRASLAYPAFILCVSIGTIIVLLGFVIPRLVTMFTDLGQALPLPTKILIDTSDFLRHFWWLFLAGAFIAVFFFQRLYHNPRGRLAIDKFKLNFPLLGGIHLKTQIGRFTRTLSLLASSGIPIVQALDVSLSGLSNRVLAQEVKKFKEEIAGGNSLSHCLRHSKTFPAFVTNIVAIGEETGTLEKSLLRIADDYEREADRALKSLTRLLEPVIILVMGLIVGFMVLSMLLPIFQINLIAR
jgi:type II secretion system protein F